MRKAKKLAFVMELPQYEANSIGEKVSLEEERNCLVVEVDG